MRTCVSELEKWLQLLFIRWYRSPRNWFPISSIIRRTSSSLKSVHPICILCLWIDDKGKISLKSIDLLLFAVWDAWIKWIYLKRNCSPSSSWSRGGISNIPVNGNGWPPYANSVPNISTPEWNTPNPKFVVYSLIQYCGKEDENNCLKECFAGWIIYSKFNNRIGFMRHMPTTLVFI